MRPEARPQPSDLLDGPDQGGWPRGALLGRIREPACPSVFWALGPFSFAPSELAKPSRSSRSYETPSRAASRWLSRPKRAERQQALLGRALRVLVGRAGILATRHGFAGL
jgi:hypothetical protein